MTSRTNKIQEPILNDVFPLLPETFANPACCIIIRKGNCRRHILAEMTILGPKHEY